MISTKSLLSGSFLLLSSIAFSHNAFDPYASFIVNSSGSGQGIYGQATAALGKPTIWIKDTVNGGISQKLPAGITYGAWNVSPENNPLVVTIPTGGQLTVGFKKPIFDNPKNWYGLDFIVFGNSFLASNATFTSLTSPNSINILGGPDFLEPMQVSVSPDLISWYNYPVSNLSAADALWPTQAFRWNSATGSFGEESDFSQPVNPALTRSNLTGRTLANCIEMYQGSGGGTAFDLVSSGFTWIKYIRFTGNGGEIDAVSRVRPRIKPVTNPISP